MSWLSNIFRRHRDEQPQAPAPVVDNKKRPSAAPAPGLGTAPKRLPAETPKREPDPINPMLDPTSPLYINNGDSGSYGDNGGDNNSGSCDSGSSHDSGSYDSGSYDSGSSGGDSGGSCDSGGGGGD